MKKSSSQRWLKEHFSDTYVKRAKDEGFRARSVYKLMEINERYKIIKPGMVIVDLGAAPGGWSEYVAKLLGAQGKIFALDLLVMHPIKHVEFMQGDFTQAEMVKGLEARVGRHKVDVVLSDMAPNLSGVKEVDQMRALVLANQVLDFCRRTLKPQGVMLIKTFQGGEFEALLKKIRQSFTKVHIIKPQASRARSNEVFLLASSLQENIGDFKVVQ